MVTSAININDLLREISEELSAATAGTVGVSRRVRELASLYWNIRDMFGEEVFKTSALNLKDSKNFTFISGYLEAHKEQIKRPEIAVRSIIVPEKKISEGLLIRSTSLVWISIVKELGHDWTKAYQIAPHAWEEIIAGAYKKAGYDEVVLTPRSGDHGRDVIAVRKGIGSVRILGSVKAYKPGHLITKAEVHSLMGVVAMDRNASKGIFTTTSDFAPLILDDPNLAASVPHRIELMNGEKLRKWLADLLNEPNDT